MDYHELFFPHFFPCSSEQDMTLGIGAYHPECCLLLVRRAGGADSPGPRMRCTTPGMAAHYRACVCGAFGRWPGSGMAGEAWGRACRNTGPLGGSRLLHSSQSTGVYETFQDTSLRQNRVPPLLNPSPFVNHLTMALVLRSLIKTFLPGRKSIRQPWIIFQFSCPTSKTSLMFQCLPSTQARNSILCIKWVCKAQLIVILVERVIANMGRSCWTATPRSLAVLLLCTKITLKLLHLTESFYGLIHFVHLIYTKLYTVYIYTAPYFLLRLAVLFNVCTWMETWHMCN